MLSNTIVKVQATVGTLPQAIPTTFPFQLPGDILVLDSGTAYAFDPPNVLVLNSDYTVTGGGYDSLNNLLTGTVTVNAAGSNGVAVGDVITVMRNVAQTQLTSSTQSVLTNGSMEVGLDKLTMLVLEQGENLSRCLQVEANETYSGILPRLARANRFQAYDANGLPIFTTSITGGSVGIIGTPAAGQLAGWTNLNTLQGITVGSGLTLTGTTLSATGGGAGNPAGATTTIQYNNGGVFGGTAGLTWNNATGGMASIQTSNAFLSGFLYQNSSTGTAAQSAIQIENNTSNFNFILTGSGYTGSSPVTGGLTGTSANIYTSGAVGLNIGTAGLLAIKIDSAQNITCTGKLLTSATASLSAINVGNIGADPSGIVNGDMWYNTSSNALRAQINGATVSLGAGGGGGTPGGSSTQLQWNNSGSFAGTAGLFWTSGTGLLANAQTSNALLPLLLIQNASTGTAAGTEVILSNTTANFNLVLTGSGYTSGAPLTGGPTGTSANIYTTGPVPLAFGTGGIAALTISAAGNVSIGAASSTPAFLVNPSALAGGNGVGISNLGGTLVAAVNGDTNYGVNCFASINTNGKTGLTFNPLFISTPPVSGERV